MCSDPFSTTHWSVVVAAGNSQTSRSREALAVLCEKYWQPLYAYVRRRGHTVEEAQDLTQEFFTRLMEKNYLGDARQERGKFRAFLLVALKHFLANEWHKAHAQKRGGGHPHIPLDFALAESRQGLEPVDDHTPDKVYEKQWAVSLLDQVLRRLRQEQERAGKAKEFNHLKAYLASGSVRVRYAEIAQRLEVSEGAVKVAVHRLRKRYRALLREEILATVADPKNADDELRHLVSALSS